ncbi:NAD(P)H-hydrate epimerase [Gryllotalpicola ginsengisoli]|uniref:NAD(P)H-hydrate epimerase n=1 Tax=Gryllotalpicola ginsengisoli TaxID=444608 RepID=UPI0004070D0A|nr:NAD(P)H-hydrate epimerase [Gryllotalpicola ginsengisoli]
MKGYSAEQIRAAEAPHLAVGEPLMARAAAAVAGEVERMLGARVVALVGGGNNGGDALFAAATLAEHGAQVELIRTSSRVHEQGLAAALAAGAHLLDGDADDLAAAAARADVIVDGILGTGTSPDPRLRGPARDLVVAIRALPSVARVVAVDIPSGIHPDTGAVPDPAAVLPADVTVTFGAAKAGLLIEPGRSFAGAIRVVEIGIEADLEPLTPLVDLDPD